MDYNSRDLYVDIQEVEQKDNEDRAGRMKIRYLICLFLLVFMAGTELIHLTGLDYFGSMVTSGIVCGAGAAQILIHSDTNASK